MVGKNLDHPVIRQLLKYHGDKFSGREMQAVVAVYSNETLLNSETTLSTWLNAYEYHQDHDKRESLAALHQLLPFEWSRGLFFLFLVEKVDAIRQLAVLVRLVLGQLGRLDVNLRPQRAPGLVSLRATVVNPDYRPDPEQAG